MTHENVFWVCEWVYDEELTDRPSPHIEMVGVFSTKEKAVAECLTESHFFGEFQLDHAEHGKNVAWPTKDCFPLKSDA